MPVIQARPPCLPVALSPPPCMCPAPPGHGPMHRILCQQSCWQCSAWLHLRVLAPGRGRCITGTTWTLRAAAQVFNFNSRTSVSVALVRILKLSLKVLKVPLVAPESCVLRPPKHPLTLSFDPIQVRLSQVLMVIYRPLQPPRPGRVVVIHDGVVYRLALAIEELGRDPIPGIIHWPLDTIGTMLNGLKGSTGTFLMNSILYFFSSCSFHLSTGCQIFGKIDILRSAIKTVTLDQRSSIFGANEIPLNPILRVSNCFWCMQLIYQIWLRVCNRIMNNDMQWISLESEWHQHFKLNGCYVTKSQTWCRQCKEVRPGHLVHSEHRRRYSNIVGALQDNHFQFFVFVYDNRQILISNSFQDEASIQKCCPIHPAQYGPCAITSFEVIELFQKQRWMMWKWPPW